MRHGGPWETGNGHRNNAADAVRSNAAPFARQSSDSPAMEQSVVSRLRDRLTKLGRDAISGDSASGASEAGADDTKLSGPIHHKTSDIGNLELQFERKPQSQMNAWWLVYYNIYIYYSLVYAVYQMVEINYQGYIIIAMPSFNLYSP